MWYINNAMAACISSNININQLDLKTHQRANFCMVLGKPLLKLYGIDEQLHPTAYMDITYPCPKLDAVLIIPCL